MKEERIIIIDEGIDEVTPEARACCRDHCLPLEANEPIKLKSSNLFIKPRRSVMKEERIIIIDEGIDEVTPRQGCAARDRYFAFRG